MSQSVEMLGRMRLSTDLMSALGQTRQSATAQIRSGLASKADIRSARLVAQGDPNGLLDAGDVAGYETWHRILNAIERRGSHDEFSRVAPYVAPEDR